MRKILIALIFALAASSLFAQENYPVPPAGVHPRLYVQKKDINALREKAESPTGGKILRALAKAGVDRTPEEEAKEKDRGFRYYFRMRGVTSRAQIQALNYLLYQDKAQAREAITTMLDTLRRTNFGRKNDLSRASGVMLMVGGMVYDWCYDQMSPDERQAYIKEFIRIAGTMECHYPPKDNEPIAGHSSEWMLLRDMLSAGIAVYDEYPDMYNYVMKLFTEKYVPVRNYIYSGGNYHQGTSYVNVRFSNDMICQWIMARMGYPDFFSRDQQYVMYDFIYRRRPDGQVLPAGDTNHSREKEASYSLPMMLAASYYNDPYLQFEYERNISLEPHTLMFRLLWQDFDLTGKAPDSLPLSRYSGSPFGWMTARTGWDAWSVVAEMKINEQYVGNHQHLDGGSFQIYYRGPLAIDTGMYQGSTGGYNSDHNKNYTKRTIAHNSLLIYDPSEVYECYAYGGEGQTPVAVNEGGQRLVGKGWDTCRSFEDLLSEEYTVGKTLAHGFGPDKKKPEYTLLKGDITKAYRAAKVSDVRRSFVFLNLGATDVPAAMIVCDHVVSTDASFPKTWLLHSIEEPSIDGQSFTVGRTKDGDQGMLRCDVLWPKDAKISKVGGPGMEFFSGGKNWPNKPRTKDIAGESGSWRIEENPGQSACEDVFLNVMQVADNGCKTLRSVASIEGEGVVGALIADRAVLFARDGGVLDGNFRFTLPNGVSKKTKVLLTDLSEGTWVVKCNGKPVVKAGKPGSDDHAIYFTATAGEYSVEKL
ncbi:MAG: DUF4962 domain-containing protein [Bacteroidales bacterium]|nr:DUF4962 domain-containing protein [Bacteroidales bacterium]